MEAITRHYLISGRVQGVGFRAFTRTVALNLKLRGWVRNLADGRVEAVAQGSQTQINDFEAKLRVGPPHGRVETLAHSDLRAHEDFADFELRKDGQTPCSEN